MTPQEREENLQIAARLYWKAETPKDATVAELLMHLFRGDEVSPTAIDWMKHENEKVRDFVRLVLFGGSLAQQNDKAPPSESNNLALSVGG